MYNAVFHLVPDVRFDLLTAPTCWPLCPLAGTYGLAWAAAGEDVFEVEVVVDS